jgi:Fe-S oxidoreductase
MSIDTLELKSCIQCGRCSGGCPVSMKSTLNPRKLVYCYLNDLCKDLSADELGLWECTTCTTCTERCPKAVRPADLVVEMRAKIIESGRMTTQIQGALESTYLQGNPWGRGREKRMEWAAGLDLPILKPGDKTDVLLFTCCTNAYDPRCQPAAQALVKLLRAAGVEFGVIGEEETCCSSEQKRIGEQGMFEELRDSNTKMLLERGPKRVVVTSPHSYNAFKNDYPGLDVPVMHCTQLLAELLDAGKLKVTKPLEEVVTYHDPCYLGKQNKVFEQPRQVLQALAGDRFVELDRSRETSLCCEGGGGRMWFESAGKGRLAETRVTDSIDLGATILATACPYCTLTLEDAVKTTDSEAKLRIKDVAELLAEAI